LIHAISSSSNKYLLSDTSLLGTTQEEVCHCAVDYVMLEFILRFTEMMLLPTDNDIVLLRASERLLFAGQVNRSISICHKLLRHTAVKEKPRNGRASLSKLLCLLVLFRFSLQTINNGKHE